MSLNADLRRLTPLGWLMAALSLGAIVAVAIPLGAWILHATEPPYIRENKSWLVFALALPCLLAAVVVFLLASRLARLLGLRVIADG